MTLRLALLGVAHVHAPAYAALLAERGDVVVSGFSEDDPATAAAFAARTGLRHLPLGSLLASRPDGVLVCSETAKHRALVKAAAAAGAAVLCEKPIATSEADALAMQRVCTAAGVPFVTAFPARFSAAAVAVAAQLRSGQLGAVLAYSGVNHSVAPDREQPWFSDPLRSGGGAGMDHIVHLADLLRFFAERPVSVYARLRPVPEWTAAQATGDAAGIVTLRLASGATATIDCSWSRPQNYPRWGHLKLDVTAECGLLSLNPFAQQLYLAAGHTSWADYGTDLNAALLGDFLQVCRTGEPGRATWQDGYEALRVVLAAYQSSASGQPVELAW